MVTLLPFQSTSANVQLTADLQIIDQGLDLQFHLQDNKKQIANSLQEGLWQTQDLMRADGLWKNTCFEAFFGRPNEASYWELNLSPLGKWNLYHFQEYRKPQPPTANFDFEITKLQTTPTQLLCQIKSKLKNKVPISSLEVSLCAVIKTQSNETFYYSNQHGADKADFHRRQNFTIIRGHK